MPGPVEHTALIEERVARLRETQPRLAARLAADVAYATALRRLLHISDYAFERLLRDPGLAAAIEVEPVPPVLAPDREADWPDALRRYRHACSVRLAWRDANGLDPVDATLAGTSVLADRCCALALDALEGVHAQRHGIARNAGGEAQRLIVYALGKHGGSELNFSSDIDLVFAYPEGGHSDGARALDNEIYFQRLGQRLIQLLGEITGEGFVYRVDMRLRPFGTTGRLALSFAAMEQYYQREGRDWERYAWVKARPVAGDLAAGEQFLDTLRPFVYRRYLDYGAFEGLREMKALIEAEVQRRDLAEHLKLGPGGIREIEFIVQLQQLIRAGREPDLRLRGLLPALALLRERGHLAPESVDALAAAYRFLRRLENRLQMLREEQTHVLPQDAATLARIATGLDYPDWSALARALERHRATVSAEFARVFEARERGRVEGDILVDYWRRLEREVQGGASEAEGAAADNAAASAQILSDAGFAQAEALHARLREFAGSHAVRSRSARARSRIDRVLPILLAAAARSARPDEAAERALALVNAVIRRSSYLALLDEQPIALARLVEVMAASAWMSERLCAHPVLLDDLLDSRVDALALDRADVAAVLQRALAQVEEDDDEARLLALNEFRQSQSFRIALATVLRKQPAVDGTRQLAWVAEAVIGAALPAVLAGLEAQHGRLPPGAGLALCGYGSFGGEELGFGSDLDLVFLYDGAFAACESDGARPLDAARYHARAVQKLISLLATLTPAGRLYEIDPRLRPDGAKGLLVSTLQSFDEYQRERAWTWEHQALVRARFIAGEPAVGARFDAIRREALARPREAPLVWRDVTAMRQRMRQELDRSHAGRFDLKQGEGGLVDLEFLLQAGVLTLAATVPALLAPTRTPELIDALGVAGWLAEEEVDALREAHVELLTRSLACTLDARPRLASPDATLQRAREALKRATARHDSPT